MTVFEKIKKLLDNANIKYSVIEHPPVYTSEEASKIRDSDVEIGAKSLVVRADGKPILLVLPGDKKADFKSFKKRHGIKDMTMAKPEKVKEITTLEIGSIPPVGKAMGLKSYFDKSFLDKEDVAFNAGYHTVSIIMKAKDLIKVEQPIIEDIVK